jgi:hypothetical protein
MNNADDLRLKLAQYSGSAKSTKYPRSLMSYTDGVLCFAKNARASWLLDIIATEPVIREMVMKGGFAMVMLTVTSAKTGNINVSDEEQMFRSSIPHTDCPEGEWNFYLERTKDNKGKDMFVFRLPSEH